MTSRTPYLIFLLLLSLHLGSISMSSSDSRSSSSSSSLNLHANGLPTTSKDEDVLLSKSHRHANGIVGGREVKTDTPVIGVLSQETYSVNALFPEEEFQSYIAASYVKFLEMGGARVVPIWIGRDRAYYEKVVNYTNGLFMPGGATWFNQSNGYADAGQHLYDIAKDRNARGDYFPVWGTCLGMELLVQASLNGLEIRDDCDARKVSLPLEFKSDFRTSKLFSKTPDHIINILQSENVTYNYHQFCFTESTFSKHGLDEHFKVLSTNLDQNGVEFISSYEHVEYPFFGIQFHAEKNPFEFKFSSPILEHSDAAIEMSQYFSRFIVNLARQSDHAFETRQQMKEALIYNFNPRYTSILNGSYEQLYMFTKEDNLRDI